MASTMNCTVTVYSSPFGATDHAGSEAVLLASVTAQSSFQCDLLPYRNGVHVRCYTSDCSNIDTASYLKLLYSDLSFPIYAVVTDTIPIDGDTYEFVTEIAPELTVLPHATSITGVTERVHVPKSSDTIGAYIEDDPYLGCTEPLEIATEMMYSGQDYDGTDGIKVAAATFDLNKLGDASYAEALQFLTQPSGLITQVKSVTVPDIPALRRQGENDTKKQLVQIPISDGNSIVMKDVESPAIDYFDSAYYTGNESVTKGMSVAHSLNASDGIVAQYTIPKGFTGFPSGHTVNSGRFSDGGSDYVLKGAYHQETSSLNFEHSNVQNKRLLVGKMNTYGITAVASGENAEFNPEDIIKNASGTAQKAPVVECFTDPRENGMPSFKFKFINKSHDMFRGIVKGLQWQNVPLVNSQKPGYGKDMYTFTNEGKVQELQSQYAFRRDISNAFLSGGSGSVRETYSTYEGSKDGSTYAGSYDSSRGGASYDVAANGLSMLRTTISGYQDLKSSRVARQAEANQIVVADKLVAPTMRFNFNPSVRDAVGNGVCVYRYKPSAKDLTRLDKLLNMFGYRVTKQLELSDFSNRSRYNYVKASAVHIVAPTLPRYIIEAAEQSIEMGVRIWHVPYDGNYTTANN